MPILKCWLTLRTFDIKKVCSVKDMPKSATYHTTIFVGNESFDIWRTPNLVFYSKPPAQ